MRVRPNDDVTHNAELAKGLIEKLEIFEITTVPLLLRETS